MASNASGESHHNGDQVDIGVNGRVTNLTSTQSPKMGVRRQIFSLWRTWVIILTPIVFLPLPIIHPSKAGRCAYGVAIMAIYWMTEAIPMAVTALLPIVIMPWLGVVSSKDVAVNYLKDTNMLFFGGLIVAVAVEKWNLHKRIALRVLLLVGSEPRWLMFGFMITTAFLSMWISNTATTAMMVPIAQAVLGELEKHRQDNVTDGEENQGFDHTDGSVSGKSGSQGINMSTTKTVAGSNEVEESIPTQTSRAPAARLGTGNYARSFSAESADSCTEMLSYPAADQVRLTLDKKESKVNPNMETMHMSDMDVDTVQASPPSEQSKADQAFQEMCKGITLCVAYAANIGGTATLTGTGPNLVMKGQVDTIYGGGAGINFSSWFIYSFPNMLVTLLFAWIWLQILFLGCRQTFNCCKKDTKYNTETVKQVIRLEYNKLGPFSFAELAVLGHFILLALLWLTREPEFIPGWSAIFPEETRGYITDACVAITISVALFIFPSRVPNIFCFRKANDESEPGSVPALLDWETVHQKMAWGVVLVLGGGFALAHSCKVSGLSDAIGNAFNVFSDTPTWLLVVLLCTITATFTEVTSNVATATIFLPILAELAESLSVNPLYLLVPVTVSTSFAFMLPVATPPNAIVFAYGNMKIIDMVKAGIVMNIVCIVILTISINTWGYAYFKLHTFPDWANETISSGVINTLDPNNTLYHNCSQLLGISS